MTGLRVAPSVHYPMGELSRLDSVRAMHAPTGRKNQVSNAAATRRKSLLVQVTRCIVQPASCLLVADLATLAVLGAAMATDAPTLTIVGQLTDEGVECPALRADDGQLYTLLLTDLRIIEGYSRVRVTGTKVSASYCMQGITIDVKSIEQFD